MLSIGSNGHQMNSEREPVQLADAVERVGRVGGRPGDAPPARRRRGLARRRGGGSASALWRASRVAVVLPDGEQVDGTVRGIDPATDLAVVTFADTRRAGRSRATATRAACASATRCSRSAASRRALCRRASATSARWPARGAPGAAVMLDRLIRLDGGLYPGLPVPRWPTRRVTCSAWPAQAFSRHHGVVVPAATIERVVDPLLTHGRVPRVISASRRSRCARSATAWRLTVCS